MEMIEGKILAFTDPLNIEPSALQQLRNVASLPFIYKHVAVMPDVHLGKGATVGSVIATKGAIVPAAVGVDIGCGMIAAKTAYRAEHLPDNLEPLRLKIEKAIPLGAGAKHQELKGEAEKRYRVLTEHKCYDREADYTKLKRDWHLQLGTLGSGNHFIEVCLDEGGAVWLVLHSGSRGIGNVLAQKHIRVAQKLMDKWHIKLPDKDLAYLVDKTEEFSAYIRDLLWSQEYALHNREIMMDLVTAAFLSEMPPADGAAITERINCHHNFTQKENHGGENVWVTRKGAIQMREGDKGVIPGSMGTRSYIVSGKGNKAAFDSAPHGAGRNFSRNEARRRFTMEDFDRLMAGIECRRSEALIDELPGAYKDIDRVMEDAGDLVNVEHILKQVLNVKGD